MLCLGLGLFAQSTFNDNFESYTLGAYIGQSSPVWTTWSGTEGGAEDAQAVNTRASSGAQSAYWVSNSPGGGPQDVILPFGGQYNTGTFHFQMDMYVTSGKGAYWNFQANSTPGQQWALECYMNQNGILTLSNTSGTYVTTNYPTGQWFELYIDINLNTNVWTLTIDNVVLGTFANPVNQVASMDIYAANPTSGGGNDQAEFWIDNIQYIYTAYTLPTLNAAVVNAGGINPATRAPGQVTGLVGQTKTIAATVRNLGVDPITSFDLAYSYSGSVGNESITGVNIPSLGTQMVTFTAPATLASGTTNLNVTVSNVNGLGPDGDPADDISSQAVTISAVPAANKIVVAEEGTGTWCQWCPRGAVYMDYMHDTYDDYFAGIAVHNGDAMTLAEYDGPFSGFLQGYPSVLVERGTAIDPLDMEQEFLSKVQLPAAATLLTGANWDANTRTLDVSVTYTFTSSATDLWRVACVLIEDSVTGTGTLYNQANAYGNNAVGPMGGFELLPSNVPAAQMNYNHVARALSPNFGGATGFPATVNPGDIHTFNFSYVLPATWDENQISIVGMLIDDGGEIDNGSKVSIDQAIQNGFTTGTVITGNTLPLGPDALVSLYPNPTQGNAWLSLNLKADTEVSVMVTDIQGRKLSANDYGILNGGQRIEVNTNGFAKGLYFVKVIMGDVVKVERLVVE